jgi:hypothetical protein
MRLALVAMLAWCDGSGWSAAAPVINNLIPNSGSTAGGTTVSISGTDLAGATAVTFDGLGSAITVNTDTQLTVLTPAHVFGIVDVAVTTPSGTTTAVGAFHYLVPPLTAPSLSGLAPTTGPIAGGTLASITGSALTGATAVTFGGLAGAITANTDTQLIVLTPMHTAGLADLVVTTPGGSVTAAAVFLYTATATLPDSLVLSPTTGTIAGGIPVTITGTSLSGATSVTFGGLACLITFDSDTQLIVMIPAHAAGAVDVAVTTAAGTTTSTAAFFYFAPLNTPVITPPLVPASGPITGGTAVTIGGSFLSGATNVTFDGLPAAITANSDTQLTVLTPAHAAGAVDIIVTTAGGGNSAPSVGAFTYTPTGFLSAITGVSPAVGLIAGGSMVTITGTSLSGATQATFGGLDGAIIGNTDTQVFVLTPAHAAGAVDVAVTITSVGTLTSAGAFSYVTVVNGGANTASSKPCGLGFGSSLVSLLLLGLLMARLTRRFS